MKNYKKPNENAPGPEEADYFHFLTAPHNDIVIQVQLDGMISSTNDEFAKLINQPIEEILHRNIATLPNPFHSKIIHHLLQQTHKALPETTLIEESIFINHINRWIQWISQPVLGKNKKIIEIKTVGRDITSLKRIEETTRVQRDLAVMCTENEELDKKINKLFLLFGILTTFPLRVMYRFSPEKNAFHLTQAMNQVYPEFSIPPEISLESEIGQYLAQPCLHHLSCTEEKKLAHQFLLPDDLKSAFFFPIVEHRKVNTVYILGTSEFSELPSPVYSQLSNISDQINNCLREIQSKVDLTQREDDLQTLFNSLDQMLLIIDKSGNIYESNRSYITGHNQTIFELHPAEIRGDLAKNIQQVKRNEHNCFETQLIAQNGEIIEVEINFTFTRWKNENRIVALYTDISRQIRLQTLEHEQREFAANLVKIANAFNSSLDLDTILDNVINALGKAIPSPIANIMLVDNNVGRVVRASGYEQLGIAEIINSRRFKIDQFKCLSAQCTDQNEIVIFETQNNPNWTPLPESHWIRSYLGVPIVIKGQVFAVINCDSNKPNAFTYEQASRVKMIADQAAIAIENANVHAETKKRLKQIALMNELTRSMIANQNIREILPTLSEKILALFDANAIVITKWNVEQQTATVIAKSGSGLVTNSLKIGELCSFNTPKNALKEKQIKIINLEKENRKDREKYQRFTYNSIIMTIPLFAQDVPVGTAFLGFPQNRKVTQEEISIGEYTAQQIATIIYKANLFEQIDLKREQFEHANALITSLSFVATSMLTTNDIEGIIQTMITGLENLNIHSAIFFLNPEGDSLSFDYSSHMDELRTQVKRIYPLRDEKITLSIPNSSVFHQAIEEQKLLFIQNPSILLREVIPPNIAVFANRIQAALKISENTKLMILPLIVAQKTIGLLCLFGENLEQIDMKAGEIFNSQISIALDNARLMAEVKRLAVTDELTVINNRRGLFEMGNRALATAIRQKQPLTCLMIDLDNFKEINDKYGHAIGDIALQEVTRKISQNIRSVDIFGRYGGEEFVVLLIQSDLQASVTVAERIREAVAINQIKAENEILSATISIGVAESNSDIESLAALIKQSDLALYVAKHNGRNQVATFQQVEKIPVKGRLI
jgi:diguanylate cyclase (GGDEF)-like protein/PAS domain S-box-containing protein